MNRTEILATVEEASRVLYVRAESDADNELANRLLKAWTALSADTKPSRWIKHAACITFADHGIIFEFDSSHTNTDGFRALARTLLGYSAGALQCAIARGDDTGDPPGTFENAVAGCGFLTQFAQEFYDAADAFEEAESKAGGDA